MRLFVTGTGTNVGKTYASVALAQEWIRRGLRPAAVKPFETGCAPRAADAETLAEACGSPHLASLPAFYRAQLPAAPYAATLAGEPPPAWSPIVGTLRGLHHRPLLIEGAGGPLVPVDETHLVIDLARALEAEVLLVAANRLGVLSHALAAAEAITARGLQLRAILLTHPQRSADPSTGTNARILRHWLTDRDETVFSESASATPARKLESTEHQERKPPRAPVFELPHGSLDVRALANLLVPDRPLAR